MKYRYLKIIFFILGTLRRTEKMRDDKIFCLNTIIHIDMNLLVCFVSFSDWDRTVSPPSLTRSTWCLGRRRRRVRRPTSWGSSRGPWERPWTAYWPMLRLLFTKHCVSLGQWMGIGCCMNSICDFNKFSLWSFALL